jgi:hypothetical protein
VKLEMTAEDRCEQYAYSLDAVLPLVAAAEYVRHVVEAATVHGLDGQHVSVPRVMEHHRSVDSYNLTIPCSLSGFRPRTP